MKYLLAGIGGFFGSITRYKLSGIISNKSIQEVFPVATFFINITGAILLGIVVGMNINKEIYYLVGDGFLGAFTTFSTFMYEDVTLIRKNKFLNASLYMILSMILGIGGFILGEKIIEIMI